MVDATNSTTTSIPGLLEDARGLPGIFLKLVDRTQPHSTKRALALLAGGTLCLCGYALTLAVVYQAASRGVVDGQLVWALLGVMASVAILAGASYRKPEAPPPGSPAQPPVSQA